jgi:acetyl esterase/lipase
MKDRNRPEDRSFVWTINSMWLCQQVCGSIRPLLFHHGYIPMKLFIIIVAVIFLVVAGTIALAIVFGGPGHPPPLASINDPFKHLDYSDLPTPRHFVARDGTSLAYRIYTAPDGRPRGSVVLIHGSSASGKSMHVMAKAFASGGYTAFALDIRGHGESGTKGDITYVGQLEDDLEDFLQSVETPQPATLAGFSSGGGFVLRFAGSIRQKLFANYLLLSPFIGQDAPTYRFDSGWGSRRTASLHRYCSAQRRGRAFLRPASCYPVRAQ